MRKSFLVTAAALALGSASLWAASSQAQSISKDDMAVLSQKAAYAQSSERTTVKRRHPVTRHEAAVYHRRHYAQQPYYYRRGYAQAPMSYYSPMNPYGYDYGYRRGVDVTATGSIAGATPGVYGVYGPSWGQTPGQSWISYCSAKYPTYDKTSNTVWAPDGQQYLCQ
ncbi:hypothetical protein [Microvirga flavescens]|uniref:hypothetical protein n=1 Tax=Microvirga flavescens TaxID=2249811 RepID=UPI000DD8CABC|nr:hypothetical protein [Microvirga flavescens]